MTVATSWPRHPSFPLSKTIGSMERARHFAKILKGVFKIKLDNLDRAGWEHSVCASLVPHKARTSEMLGFKIPFPTVGVGDTTQP